MPRHVRKGDTVIVTKGSSKGVVGEILRVVDDGERVVVKGANIRTKHLKPNQMRPKGAMVKVELPIHISKVSPMADGKPTRVRFTVKADGTKVRVAAKGGKELGSVSPSRKSTKAK